jgi:glycosyltransferase involved in cell wall biosynthesis
MPSLYEGLPGSVIEAQGSSLPCILSDSITKEVAVTNLVEYLSLNDGIDMWVESILKKKNYKRRNTKDEIVNAGFDMNTIAMKLEEFYIEEGNKHANVQKKDRLS